MDTFPFTQHVPGPPIYPKGDGFQFGRGYTFASAPQLPLQRRFKLKFDYLCWRRNGADAFDATIEPATNALAFLNFYEKHTGWKSFIYVHDVYGSLIVKFAADTPPQIGEPMKGGSGVTDGFDVMIIEQPL
jgi:hypothetical protein